MKPGRIRKSLRSNNTDTFGQGEKLDTYYINEINSHSKK